MHHYQLLHCPCLLNTRRLIYTPMPPQCSLSGTQYVTSQDTLSHNTCIWHRMSHCLCHACRVFPVTTSTAFTKPQFSFLPCVTPILPISTVLSRWRRGLRPLAWWHCGFESRRRYGCPPLVSVVCCQVEFSVKSRSLVQRSPVVCVCVSLSVIRSNSNSTATVRRYKRSD